MVTFLAENESEDATPKIVRALELHWQKSNFFRVIHADGAYGGFTPDQYIHFAFYNERRSIPRRTRVLISEEGSPATEEITDINRGAEREVEVDVVMDLETAMNFHGWLGESIDGLRKMLEISDEDFEQMRQRSVSLSL